MDDPEKIGSTEFDVVYVQEATELDEDDWAMLLRGLRNGVLSYRQIIADCNPSSPDHWLKQRCNSLECLLLESKHEDNPQLYRANAWTDFGKEYMQTLDSLTGFLYQRLRLGLWVAAEGMYFTEWDPNLHLCPSFEIPPEWPRWLAVDYGFAAPFCCLWFAREPETRKIFVYRELYAAGLRDEQQAEAIKSRSEGERLNLRILDPSMFNLRTEQQRPSIAAVYWSHGVNPVFPGMNSRKQGWAITRRALAHDAGPPRLQILAGAAPNLQRTLPAMVVDPLDPEDVADSLKGSKTEDHAPDALRYGLCAEAQPPRPTQPTSLRFG
jgi:phage terminase large subunit